MSNKLSQTDCKAIKSLSSKTLAPNGKNSRQADQSEMVNTPDLIFTANKGASADYSSLTPFTLFFVFRILR